MSRSICARAAQPATRQLGMEGEGSAQVLAPNMRFIFVPHTGHVPWAARRPFAISTSSPSNSRFSLHFTQ